MQNQARVSVIIPTYNRPDLVGRAIMSILNQTYQDFEIVVIDSSPDNKTEKAIKDFNELRIKYVHNKIKTNAGTSRNQGVKESSQESQYIAFLDDDDEFFPQFLEKTVAVLEENKDISIVTSDWVVKTTDGKKIRDGKYPVNFWEVPIGGGWVIKKEIFTKENFWYDEKIEAVEDFDLGIRIFKNHKWKCVPEVLRVYYIIRKPGKATTPSNAPTKGIDVFYEKNYPIFRQLGNQALGNFHFRIGKVFLRVGASKKGRGNLLKAFLAYPRPKYLLFYLLSLITIFFPNLFKNTYLRKLNAYVFSKN